MKLHNYNTTVTYEPGSGNPADYMSRHPTGRCQDQVSMVMDEQQHTELHVNFVVRHSLPRAITQDHVVEATYNDRTLSNVIQAISDGRWFEIIGEDPIAQSLYKLRSELSVSSEGILLRGTRIVMPVSLQKQCVTLAHAGHQGIVKTKSLLRSKVWFAGIDKLVENEVDPCIACQASTTQTKREPLQMTTIPTEKLAIIHCIRSWR